MSLATVEAGAAALRAYLGIGARPACVARAMAAGPGRQVVDYRFELDGDRPAPRLVGKFYPDDEGRRAYATMTRLCARLEERPGALLAVPAPTFYDPGLRLLALARVEGEPLADLARGPRAGSALHLVGRALAELHRLPAPAILALGLRDHLADLVRPHPEVLPAHHGALGRRAMALLAELLAAEDHTIAPAPIHRDLHLRQLFLGAGRVWLIDWDLFAAGDPALDVGNFCAYLHTHLVEGSRRAVAAFLEGYTAGGGAAAIGRAPLFAAFTYLRLACKGVRLGRPQVAGELIERGFRALAKGDTDG